MTETTTTTEAPSSPVVDLSRTISAAEVLRVAHKAKLHEGWCDQGFGRAMADLGFPELVSNYEGPEYGPEPDDRPDPTVKADVRYPCESRSCELCYDNPVGMSRRPIVKPGQYELRVRTTGQVVSSVPEDQLYD